MLPLRTTRPLFSLLALTMGIMTFGPFSSGSQPLYQMPDDGQTRWSSFENPTAAKGSGGAENKGAKGHAFDRVNAGESRTLLDVDGAGVVNRIWITVNDRTPESLRALRIDMYWDGANTPAVSAPLGDFFGVGLGRTAAFESALFSSPEGRSFVCTLPMPFRKGALIVLTNESTSDLTHLFYDVNLLQLDALPDDALYFHAYWSRRPSAEPGADFPLLPGVRGRGRFLGTNIGVLTNPAYGDTWFGEGEVKIYLDGDDTLPTLIGTGTEDYIGTGWGQGMFAHSFQGSLVAEPKRGMFAFYRYHVPDPVYFHEGVRVTIQQIGGAGLDKVRELQAAGAQLIPITNDAGPGLMKLLDHDTPADIRAADFPGGWVNFYRSDDISATAYFYLDRPANELPPLAPVDLRTADLEPSEIP